MKITQLFSWSLLLLSYNCSQPQDTKNANSTEPPSLAGLWSRDSANSLTNEGYYLSNDGTFEQLLSGANGYWECDDLKQLTIHYTDEKSDSSVENFHIDSLTSDQLFLSGPEGSVLLRKVPFGMSDELTVLSGFMGKISTNEPTKTKKFQFPPSKKLMITLNSTDSAIGFDVSRNGKQITKSVVKQWHGIIVTGGQFEMNVRSSTPKKLTESGSEFDVKVMTQ